MSRDNKKLLCKLLIGNLQLNSKTGLRYHSGYSQQESKFDSGLRNRFAAVVSARCTYLVSLNIIDCVVSKRCYNSCDTLTIPKESDYLYSYVPVALKDLSTDKGSSKITRDYIGEVSDNVKLNSYREIGKGSSLFNELVQLLNIPSPSLTTVAASSNYDFYVDDTRTTGLENGGDAIYENDEELPSTLSYQSSSAMIESKECNDAYSPSVYTSQQLVSTFPRVAEPSELTLSSSSSSIFISSKSTVEPVPTYAISLDMFSSAFCDWIISQLLTQSSTVRNLSRNTFLIRKYSSFSEFYLTIDSLAKSCSIESVFITVLVTLQQTLSLEYQYSQLCEIDFSNKSVVSYDELLSCFIEYQQQIDNTSNKLPIDNDAVNDLFNLLSDTIRSYLMAMYKGITISDNTTSDERLWYTNSKVAVNSCNYSKFKSLPGVEVATSWFYANEKNVDYCSSVDICPSQYDFSVASRDDDERRNDSDEGESKDSSNLARVLTAFNEENDFEQTSATNQSQSLHLNFRDFFSIFVWSCSCSEDKVADINDLPRDSTKEVACAESSFISKSAVVTTDEVSLKPNVGIMKVLDASKMNAVYVSDNSQFASGSSSENESNNSFTFSSHLTSDTHSTAKLDPPMLVVSSPSTAINMTISSNVNVPSSVNKRRKSNTKKSNSLKRSNPTLFVAPVLEIANAKHQSLIAPIPFASDLKQLIHSSDVSAGKFDYDVSRRSSDSKLYDKLGIANFVDKLSSFIRSQFPDIAVTEVPNVSNDINIESYKSLIDNYMSSCMSFSLEGQAMNLHESLSRIKSKISDITWLHGWEVSSLHELLSKCFTRLDADRDGLLTVGDFRSVGNTSESNYDSINLVEVCNEFKNPEMLQNFDEIVSIESKLWHHVYKLKTLAEQSHVEDWQSQLLETLSLLINIHSIISKSNLNIQATDTDVQSPDVLLMLLPYFHWDSSLLINNYYNTIDNKELMNVFKKLIDVHCYSPQNPYSYDAVDVTRDIGLPVKDETLLTCLQCHTQSSEVFSLHHLRSCSSSNQHLYCKNCWGSYLRSYTSCCTSRSCPSKLLTCPHRNCFVPVCGRFVERVLGFDDAVDYLNYQLR